MESQVISPGVGQTVVAVEGEHRDQWGRVLSEEMKGADHSRREWHAEQRTRSTLGDIATNFGFTQKQVSDSATSTLVGFKDLTALSYQIQGQALLEAAKNAAALSVQADKNFYATSVEAVKNAAASELSARTIAAEAARQAAECCCEIKALILSNGEVTRSLINANQMQDLRDRNTKLEIQLQSYYTAKVAPVTPA